MLLIGPSPQPYISHMTLTSLPNILRFEVCRVGGLSHFGAIIPGGGRTEFKKKLHSSISSKFEFEQSNSTQALSSVLLVSKKMLIRNLSFFLRFKSLKISNDIANLSPPPPPPPRNVSTIAEICIYSYLIQYIFVYKIQMTNICVNGSSNSTQLRNRPVFYSLFRLSERSFRSDILSSIIWPPRFWLLGMWRATCRPSSSVSRPSTKRSKI